ncbi:MAG: zinc-ribbon domain-containing protein [Clostridia bacterium]|nr:zinc-ribbon domain-containing protein [Clostridia bacterium]MBQ4603259.1 zinc-ribbon domain-containing protein [Clostridia bacterium]
MKSIKPGRGPSFMGGVIGIAVALFGVFWTVMAIVGGAWFMAPFGLIFTGIAVARAIYDFKNATGKNRYSEYDITEENEEPDPWNERFGESNADEREVLTVKGRYCPYCGTKNEEDYKFCTDCGRELPSK